ncbi:DUF6240 domain-containing protein [Vallitalea sp.]|jgi:hypothetical protein|uniref:DUF6240 domain-containing protein n=1 Tax=Vallitalea sp. TaxID=1882829 RepID=UPI0025CCD1BC|nr:DUF6240 domain-containing protein [Vallitalea sp.]MCT4687629.1 DUF6240 domain-containing protein [Vallitalea sp.]
MNTIWDVTSTTFIIDDAPKKMNYNKDNVTGLVKNKNEAGTLIEVMGRNIMVPNNVEIKEDIGETCSFQIEEAKGDKISLKYISKEKEITKRNNKMSSFRDIWNKNTPKSKEMMDIITSMKNKDKSTIDEYKDIINSTKKQLEILLSKVTDDDIKDIIRKSYNPEKMTIDLFEKIVSKNKLAVKKDDTKKIKKEINKEIERYTKIFGSKEEIKSIINKLKEKNLPVNEHNIMKLRSALNKYDAIKQLKEEAILNVLKNNIEMTVEKLYEAKYTSGKSSSTNSSYGNNSNNQSENITNDELKELEPQIKNILKNNDINPNEKTIKAAKTLIQNNIEIDKTNIEKYLYLKDIENNIKPQQIIDKAVDNIVNNKKIDAIELTNNISQYNKVINNKSNRLKAKKTIDNLSNIKDEHLKKLIIKGKTINLDNLEKEYEDNSIRGERETNLPENQQDKYITAKRQLEEIRLKMTIESANRMIDNGIKIDTAPLNQLVEELKKLERADIKNELSSVGAKATDSNIDKMNQILETVEKARNTSTNVLGQVMKKEVDFTLKAITGNNNDITNKSNMLQEMYDKLGTKPRADLGDNIKKTFNQVESILKELNIDINTENIRAAKILAHNEMEISESNINNIKLLDQQVNIVLNRLHPNIVAHMIKDNLSPVEMNINEVTSYMHNFEELIGEDITDKIASFINEMDKDNTLSEKERKSMIGIYRMLNTISKSEGRAVGFLVKKDMKLSLNNLMEAAKYLRKTGGKRTDINVNIDDNFGTLENLKYDSESIRNQIQEAFEKAGFEVNKNNIKLIESIEEFQLQITKDNIIDMQYLENNIKELIRKSSPNNLKKILEEDGIMDKPIEEILNMIDESEMQELDTYRIREQINQVKNTSSESIRFLQKLQLPVNLKNLNTISNLLQDNNELSNKLKHLMGEFNDTDINNQIDKTFLGILDRLASGEEISNIYNEVQKELKEIKGKSFELNPNKRPNITNDLTQIDRILDMNKEMEDKEDYVQIPILLNGEMTQLNMYYIDKDKAIDENSIKVLLSLKTKNLGTVNSLVKMDDKDIEINISATKVNETKYLMEYSKELKMMIEDMGYNVSAIKYDNPQIETPLEVKQQVNNSTSDNKMGNFEIRI